MGKLSDILPDDSRRKPNGDKAREQYLAKFRDPRWQQRRLEIMQRDRWCCRYCYGANNTLNVHHRYYVWGNDPWDYPDEALVTLCEPCHEREQREMKKGKEALIRAVSRAGLWGYEMGNLADAIESARECYDLPPRLFSMFLCMEIRMLCWGQERWLGWVMGHKSWQEIHDRMLVVMPCEDYQDALAGIDACGCVYGDGEGI